MLSFILLVAILNIALGYAAAAALADPPPWSQWRLTALRRRHARAATDAHSGQADAPPPDRNPAARPSAHPPAPTVTVAGVDELPRPWLDELTEDGLVVQSFLEGVSQVLRLEVGRYREQLVGIETRSRSLLAATDSGGLKLLADDLQSINQDWLHKQTKAATLFSQRNGRLGDHETLAVALEQVLLDQAAQIEASNAALAALQFPGETDSGGKQLLEQLSTLVSAAHALRDQMLDLVASLLRTGQRLGDLGEAMRLDPETKLPNRLGLEALLAAWWQDHPQSSDPLSLVQIDIDRFARVNTRLGTRAGDRALVAAAALINELVHTDREHDRLGRLGGQSLLVLMAGTPPHQALASAERVRQSLEATTFDDHGQTFELTLSCGVVTVGPADTIGDVLRRCTTAVQFAKKAGRNRCAIDEGNGPQALDPPQLPVKGRVVPLEQ